MNVATDSQALEHVNETSSLSVPHDEMANAIRALSMDAVQAAKSGHPGMPMGMADVATVLFRDFLKFNAKDTSWADRDRFILSAGHGSMLLYSLLYLTGSEEITLDEIKNFRQLGAKTCGHPEFGEAGGIETTTGPLGQGIANSVGFALAEEIMAARFGSELVDHYTYVIAGDGCLMEGISQEAITLAGHLKLSKIVVLFDDNKISIDGPTSLSTSEDQLKRFEAAGWDVQAIDGHDPIAINAAIAQAKKTDTPSMIACDTVIGKHAPTKAGTSGSHGAPLGEEEIAGARDAMGWTSPAFEIPNHVLQAWNEVGAKGQVTQDEWNARLEASADKTKFEHAMAGKLPANLSEVFAELKREFTTHDPIASRASSGKVIEKLTKVMPELIGGSADLTGSNLTRASDARGIQAGQFDGNYVYYGIREHAMCAAMNGMALHGGVVPFGGTFFVFTDYCRPAIRLAALMNQRVIYVMTHDSIGLGEDGPTHQPVEHLSSLRAMPNTLVLRPADAYEVAESWEIALNHTTGPSILVLSRQGLPNQHPQFEDENVTAKGGYVLSDAPNAKVTIIATGSEIAIAMDAKEKLAASGTAAKVVSMPCTELFDQQSAEYKAEVLGEDTLKIAIEAASGYGWERYIGADGVFIGMDGFGASAPAKDLYKHFGITADAVIAAVKERI